MKKLNRALAATLLVVALLLLAPNFASAHEHRQVADGRYTLVVGFSSEPAYSGFLNGLDLRVSDNSMATPAAAGSNDEATGAPVEGLEDTLQAEVIYGDQKMPLTLEPRWQTPGAYDAWLVPTAAGDYSFHIFGTIGDTRVDETFTSSPDTFSSVQDQAVIQFPKASGSSSANAPVIGSIGDGASAIDGGAVGGAAAGLAVGAAGLYLVQRRRRGGHLRLVTNPAGTGD